jgi:hypothetical protein
MFDKQGMLPLESVKAFIAHGRIHAFDPDSAEHVALVDYRPDGSCKLEFSDGRFEGGVWGFTNAGYWTSYQNFRDGARNEFCLQLIAPQIMQAFHSDGRRAYVQSTFNTLPDDFKGA